MRRGTTPTLRIKVKGIGVEEIGSIYLSVKQANKMITWLNDEADPSIVTEGTIGENKVEIDEDENRIIVTLTQEETLSYKDGACQVQLRATTIKGASVASSIVTRQWEHILLEGEIE